MEDELLQKEKYLCVYNSTTGITIGDLIVKATNPVYSRPIILRQGEYILTELLDFADLKKSRMSGALARFIEMGWITVENPVIPVHKREVKAPEMRMTPISKGITEAQASGRLEMSKMVAVAPSNTLGYPEESHPKVVELLSNEQSRKPNSLAISEIDAQVGVSIGEAFDKFNSLRYFQKLKTIKETTNIHLLELIATRSTYPQLIHNSKNRLRELNGR